MPYTLSWESEGVVCQFSGIVSDEDLLTCNDDIYASPHLPEMKYQIVDFSTIEKFDVSSPTIRRVASSDRVASEVNPDVKVAIITSGPYMRGMSNMYALSHEAEGGSWDTEVFDGEEDARAWAVPSS